MRGDFQLRHVNGRLPVSRTKGYRTVLNRVTIGKLNLVLKRVTVGKLNLRELTRDEERNERDKL